MKRAKPRNYKQEAALYQRVLGVLVNRLGGGAVISGQELEESEARGLEVKPLADGLAFRVPPDAQSRIIRLN